MIDLMKIGPRQSLLVILAWLLVAGTADSQDLGHKLPGVIGLDAARIPEPGLYLVDRIVNYSADELRDRTGSEIFVRDLELRALANGFGISYTAKFSRKPLSITVTAGAPVAHLSLNVHDRPEANVDRFGLTDIYIQPARLGWRGDRFDAIGSYAIYLPTGKSPLAGGEGLSSGQITHEFAGGGSIFADKERRVFLTALGSYDLNLRKQGLDITRGETLQIQGGAGVSRIRQVLETGVATYALWQVRDDRGAGVPLALQGARDRVFGLGPEVAVLLKPIRSQIRVRYEWDLGVRSRPEGSIFVVGFTYRASRN
jgi:hypothetical protein